MAGAPRHRPPTRLDHPPPALAQRSHFFANRELALNYARLWAKANRPSILQLVARDGAITREWSYITFDPLYA